MEQPQSCSGDEVLDQEDCFNIIQELEPVAHRWYEIGLALGLTPNSLNKLKLLATEDFTKLLTSMIVEWLKLGYNTVRFGVPTWRRIVEAVRASAGGNNPALADVLEKKYCVTTKVSEPLKTNPTSPSSGTTPTSPEVDRGICCSCFSYDSMASPRQVNRGQVKYLREITIPREYGIKESSDLNGSTDLESSRDVVLAHPTWEIEEITQHEGYCGAMSAKEADERLRSFGGNCYLLRYSKRQEKYVITVLIPDAEPAITDYQIIIRMRDSHRVYEIEGTKREFPSIVELLEFYQNTPLTRSNRTIGKVCSKTNVVQEL